MPGAMGTDPAAGESAREPTVELGVLGPLEARVEGEPVSLGAPKQRALLAQLLLRANEAVPVERLVDALWPEDPPASARHAVQVYVSRLRRALGPERIEARSRAYLLRAGPEELDLARFRELVAQAREALAGEDAAGAAARLREALALWRDHALADLDGEPGVGEVVLELEEERLAAVELRVESEVEAGRGAELVPELERLVAEHPARERLHAQLMLALHRTGSQAEALEAYDRARQALLNELGLDPSLSLQELAAAIRRRDPALTPVPAELRARLHLPAQPNQFIGRECELEDLAELITVRGLRLVTLTGAGGIGKTRLALAAAERLATRFEDGVWFVDLAPVAEPSLVVPAIAQALSVTESPDQPLETALEAHLADKHTLVLVDNFEQVSEAAPAFRRLLDGAPGLTILVTSRSPLRLPAEHEYNVPPLAVPDPRRRDRLSSLAEFEAVRLLVSRARAVSHRFELTEANAHAIADICLVLDGLPLAIELAGATLKQFSPAELRQRLETSLDLLVGGPVDAPARHQTVRATIEWSYNLLRTAEQNVFARLAVFAGGWTAAAAHDVCEATDEALASLREKGLIRSDGDRFAILTPIREFALETLPPSDADSLARRHAAYFTELASAFEAHVRKHGFEPDNLDRFRADYENVRAALRWTHDAGGRELFARLAASFGVYSYVSGPYAEARQWLEVAFADPPDDTVLHGLVARSLGMVCFAQGDHRRAEATDERAIALFRSAGETELEAKSLNNAAIAAIHLGEYERGREFLMKCRERARALDDERLQVRMEHYVLNALGSIALLEGRPREAERWWTECLSLCERLREREGAATALMNLGLGALADDRLGDATARFQEGLRLADELQKVMTIVNCLVGLAGVASRGGDRPRAGRLLGITQRFLDDSGAALEPYLAALFAQTQATVRTDLGEEGAEEAFALGRGDERDAAVAYALEG
jgi:predicted ATPase/DNA-binding SARP family transcriptional activator